MALRSTIVYPLGTIAVQMGAPENLALLKAHEDPGLIVALVVATGDHDQDADLARFVGRVGVAARIHERINLPGDTVQITLQGLRRIVIDDIVQTEPYPEAHVKPAKTFRAALFTIIAADVSMSLDNVLAVAGVALQHPFIMAFGLVLSVLLMGVAATFSARIINKYPWIAIVGIIIILFAAARMIWHDAHCLSHDAIPAIPTWLGGSDVSQCTPLPDWLS